jgi:hypothetical protein
MKTLLVWDWLSQSVSLLIGVRFQGKVCLRNGGGKLCGMGFTGDGGHPNDQEQKKLLYFNSVEQLFSINCGSDSQMLPMRRLHRSPWK